jgi:hypothetical protein
MKLFLVLGFTTNLNEEVGEKLYLGKNRGEAMDELRKATSMFSRKTFHDLCVPSVEKRFPVSQP